MNFKKPLDNDSSNLINKAAGPSADVVGKSISSLFKVVCYPLLKVNAYMDEKIKLMEKETKEKVDKIPLENRDPSKIGLVLKTIEDSIYQLDSDDLRNMFSNLIASSVNKSRNEHLSPRFSTTLAQFSHGDAQFLKLLSQDITSKPSYRFILETNDGKIPMSDHYIATNIGSNSNTSWTSTVCNELSLDNLIASNIIKVNEDAWLAAPFYKKFYDSITKSTKFKTWEKSIKANNESYNCTIQKSYIEFTKFGIEFIKNVVN